MKLTIARNLSNILLGVAFQHSGAQIVGGTISGKVTDASGAAIAAPKLSIENPGNWRVDDNPTSPRGIYSIPNLLPGELSSQGDYGVLRRRSRLALRVAVGSQQGSNFAMKVGAVNQTVEVTANSGLATGNVSHQWRTNTKTMVELPLNARSWTDLATLQPGVSTIRAIAPVSSTDRLGRGYGAGAVGEWWKSTTK